MIETLVRAAIDTTKRQAAPAALSAGPPVRGRPLGRQRGRRVRDGGGNPEGRLYVLRRRVAGRRRERISNPRGCAGAGRGGRVLGQEQERCDPGRNRGAARRGWVSGAAGGARA